MAETRLEIGGKTYRITHPDSAEALIDEEEFDLDERLPYWAVVWPSAVALAHHLSELDLSKKSVVELGCGVGLPSVVALGRGAGVTATDHYPEALDFARHNARANTGRELTTAHLDWHRPEGKGAGRFDLVLAADVLYEQRNIPALAALIPDLLAPGGEALISSPERRDAPEFSEMMEAMGFHCSSHTRKTRQGDSEIEVTIKHFRQSP